MAILYVNGDLLASDCDVIAHQCNCFKVMGAGLARQVKAKYPEAYAADIKDSRPPIARLGSFTWATSWNPTTRSRIWIYNLYGQFKYGRSGVLTDYVALKSSLTQMKEHLNMASNLKIGMPFMMGCGLAGGKWATVSSLIDEVFSDTTVHVFALRG